MSRIFTMALIGLLSSFSLFAQDAALDGFNSRFSLVKDPSGKVIALRLKKVVARFSIKPFIEQLKNDLKLEQQNATLMSDSEQEEIINEALFDAGLNPFMMNSDGYEEALRTKESFLNIKNINVDAAFTELNQADFWNEFEAKMNEAFLYIDPTILTYHDDARFFYKRQIVYKVVVWALEQAKKRFSNVPVLNIASFIIVRVHDMMMEQRHFHHNMLLHYFENIPESKFGMTKEEVDRAIASIYEYRIDATNVIESNRAARDWLNYGWANFYAQVRSGTGKIRSWESGLSSVYFQNVKRLNFAFAEVSDKEKNTRKIYHLHLNAHQYSKKPALAYDYTNPKRVKQIRSILNLAGVALGFVQMPGWIKGRVEGFMKSFYVEQVRMEGALVPFFEMSNNNLMAKNIYGQRANFYIVE